MLDTPIRKSFAYPKEFVTLPEYSAHDNQIVMVLRPCAPEEADILYDDLDDGRGAIIVDRMFKVQADDGWIGDACETELEDISSDMVSDYHTGRKIVNGSDVKQRIDCLYDQIVALLEREINHDLQGYEVANSVCQLLATRLCDINTGRKIVNGSDVKQRIDCLYDQIVALLEREINHDLQGYEVANSVCQLLATRLCDINVAYLLLRALEDKLSASCTKVTSRTGDLTAKASAALT